MTKGTGSQEKAPVRKKEKRLLGYRLNWGFWLMGLGAAGGIVLLILIYATSA